MERILLAALLVALPFTQSWASEPVLEESSVVEEGGLLYHRASGELVTGLVIVRYENGLPKSENAYENGIKHGLGTTWYNDGSIHREVEYQNGEQHGLWMAWSKDEELLYAHTYQQGELIQSGMNW